MLRKHETEALSKFTEGCTDVLRLLTDQPCHPSDAVEVVTHIHAIQNLVMSRSAVRADLNHFTHLRSFCHPMSWGTREGAEVCREEHQPEERS